jgi:hypothetical protein
VSRVQSEGGGGVKLLREHKRVLELDSLQRSLGQSERTYIKPKCPAQEKVNVRVRVVAELKRACSARMHAQHKVTVETRVHLRESACLAPDTVGSVHQWAGL